MSVGTKIRKVRELKGFSQQDMAKKLEMSQNNYSKIELGRVSVSMDRFQEIADILEIEPMKIMDFDESQVFNNHDQKGGSAANLIVQEFSDKLEEAYKSEITHLKEEIQFLRKLLEKNLGK